MSASGFKRTLRAVATAVSATCVAVVCIENASAQSAQCRLPPPSPASSATPRQEVVRVVVRSAEHVSVSAEINARIVQMPRREGDVFNRGDVLVAFDCSRMQAERDVSVAAFRASQAAHEALSTLGRYNAASVLDIQKSRFEMDKAAAEVRVMDARLTTCAIQAPFSGRVVEKSAQVNEMAQPNQPLLKLIDDTNLELVLMVPSNIAGQVDLTSRFAVCIDETRDVKAARVVQSTGLIDPVSQTVRMIGMFEDRASGVLPGMSGAGVLRLKDHQP